MLLGKFSLFNHNGENVMPYQGLPFFLLKIDIFRFFNKYSKMYFMFASDCTVIHTYVPFTKLIKINKVMVSYKMYIPKLHLFDLCPYYFKI